MVVHQFGGVKGIPTTYILDRAGRVAETLIGYRKLAIFEQAVQRIRAQEDRGAFSQPPSRFAPEDGAGGGGWL